VTQWTKKRLHLHLQLVLTIQLVETSTRTAVGAFFSLCSNAKTNFDGWLTASADDERVRKLLVEYHRRGITDRKVISQLLLVETPSIQMRCVDIYKIFKAVFSVFMQ